MSRRLAERFYRRLQRAASVVRGRAIILVYHRVARLRPDPQLLSVCPERFSEQMEVLRSLHQPVPLGDVARGVISDRVPNGSVAITFDDGYADNLWNAAPLMERHDIPATVFVSTGFVHTGSESQVGLLQRYLLEPEELPASLQLDISGKRYSWPIDEKAPGEDRWDVTVKTFPTLRHRCYYDLHRLLRSQTGRERSRVLDRLAEWAAVSQEARQNHRPLNAEELNALNTNELFEIGAHGVNHLMLAAHSPDLQSNEIYGSKRHLEEMLGEPVTSFAYPYGRADAVSEETVRLVIEAGFELGCDNVPLPVTSRSDPFMLPRFLVRDWDGDEFAKRLRGFMRGW